MPRNITFQEQRIARQDDIVKTEITKPHLDFQDSRLAINREIL